MKPHFANELFQEVDILAAKRCIYIETKNKIKRYVLAQNAKPMVIVNGRLYRCDDDLMIASKVGGDAFVLYNVDSQQPQGGGVFVDPDETMAYIRIAQSNKKGNSFSVLGWFNTNPKVIMYIIIGGVILWSVVSGGILK